MITKNFKTEPIKENPNNVDARQLYSKSTAEIMHLTLKPREIIVPHNAPVDMVFYILEGSPLVCVGGDSGVFDRDILIECPKGELIQFKNESNCKARVLIIKTPRP